MPALALVPLDASPPAVTFLDVPGQGRLVLSPSNEVLLDEESLLELVTTEDDDEEEPLVQLARQLCGQYVDVMAAFAGAVFRARDVRERYQELEPALVALNRLAEATPDASLLESLRELRAIAAEAEQMGVGTRTVLLARLRRWVQSTAALLGPERGARLRRLVEVDPSHSALLTHLASVRGIGKRRQERLYAAGLHSLETLLGADPTEVALVSGVPVPVARDVVVAVEEYAAEREHRLCEELRAHAEEVRELLAACASRGEPSASLLAAARDAVTALEGVLSNTKPELP